MSWFSRLRNLIRADRVSDEIDREMAFHLAERADELTATGMSRDAAEREARRRFGNYGIYKENARDHDLIAWLDAFVSDVRYALRGLRASPAFTCAATLSLALGIGANTAIFTLVDTVMIRALPVKHADALVSVEQDQSNLSHALWEQVRDRQQVFDAVFAYASTGTELSAGGESHGVPMAFVSGGFFPTLDVRSATGRLFSERDDRSGCPPIAALSYAFWQSEYQGSAAVLGRSISLDGHSFEVVGVTDPTFFGIEVGYPVAIWVPLCAEAAKDGAARSGYNSRMSRLVMGRLKNDITIEQARAHMRALAPTMLEATADHPTSSKGMAKTHEQYLNTVFSVVPFSKGIPGLSTQYGEALLVLTGVVAVLLLIACANVANLLLARAAARQREIAVRFAIGASRVRVVRQLLTESLLLALIAAAAGTLVATWGSRALVALLASRGNLALDVAPDGRVLAFTLAVGIVTGVLFGLAPAWRAARVDASFAMKSAGRGITEARSRFGVGKGLVVVQIALSLVMVTAAGLLMGSWRRLATFDAGFERAHVLLVTSNARAAQIPADQRRFAYARILDRLRAIPGVDTASAAVRTPLGSIQWNGEITFVGAERAPDGGALVQLNEVTPGYFATIGSRVLAGRDFMADDSPAAPVVAIVNEELARRFFGSRSPIGQRLRFARGDRNVYEIVGLVANTKQSSLRELNEPVAYFPISQDSGLGPSITFALRARQSPASLIPSVRAAFAELDPRISLRIVTLEQQVGRTLVLPRTLGLLSGFFGALALLLATIGLYGIMSYTVARRRNEIGVRIALGAARAHVVRMVLGEVGRMVTVGIVIGTLLALSVTRLVKSFLYGVTPSDPTTLVLSAIALLAVALGAAMLPAWRAARLDPVGALHED